MRTDIAIDQRHGGLEQVGALIVRRRRGSCEVMLITSRDTGRWIVPKGWPMKGMPDHEAAAQEAFEEASVEGEISRDPVGSFTYEKRVDKRREIIRVTVYLLEVATKHKVWPEQSERNRRWMTLAEASMLVDKRGLRAILRQLNASTDRGCAEAPLA